MQQELNIKIIDWRIHSFKVSAKDLIIALESTDGLIFPFKLAHVYNKLFKTDPALLKYYSNNFTNYCDLTLDLSELGYDLNKVFTEVLLDNINKEAFLLMPPCPKDIWVCAKRVYDQTATESDKITVGQYILRLKAGMQDNQNNFDMGDGI